MQPGCFGVVDDESNVGRNPWWLNWTEINSSDFSAGVFVAHCVALAFVSSLVYGEHTVNRPTSGTRPNINDPLRMLNWRPVQLSAKQVDCDRVLHILALLFWKVVGKLIQPLFEFVVSSAVLELVVAYTR